LRCRFAAGLHADWLENASIADGNGLSGWVMRHRRPLINGVPIVEFAAAGTSSADIQLQSALVCPLTVADEVIGTIAVFHHDAASYTDDHRRVLEQVAHQAASVVHNALVFERAEAGIQDGYRTRQSARCGFRSREFARRTRQFSLVLLDLDDQIINDDAGISPAIMRAGSRQGPAPAHPAPASGMGDEFVSCCVVRRREANEQRRQLRRCSISLRTDDGRGDSPAGGAGANVFPRMATRTAAAGAGVAGCIGTNTESKRRGRCSGDRGNIARLRHPVARWAACEKPTRQSRC
jgi:hypothetical protein